MSDDVILVQDRLTAVFVYDIAACNVGAVVDELGAELPPLFRAVEIV
jgi:hypothetical protein